MASKTTQKVYQYLVKYITKHGYAPSVREIAKGIGLKSTSTVHDYLKKLQEEGLIEIRGNSSRAIKISGYKFIKSSDGTDNSNT